jgi:hypothetical protein
VGRQLLERLGPLLAVLLSGARAGEPELQRLVATIRQEALTGTGRLVGDLAKTGALRPGLDVDRARDVVWVLIAPEVVELLVGERGWSLADWEAWLAQALADLLLDPAEA